MKKHLVITSANAELATSLIEFHQRRTKTTKPDLSKIDEMVGRTLVIGSMNRSGLNFSTFNDFSKSFLYDEFPEGTIDDLIKFCAPDWAHTFWKVSDDNNENYTGTTYVYINGSEGKQLRLDHTCDHDFLELNSVHQLLLDKAGSLVTTVVDMPAVGDTAELWRGEVEVACVNGVAFAYNQGAYFGIAHYVDIIQPEPEDDDSLSDSQVAAIDLIIEVMKHTSEPASAEEADELRNNTTASEIENDPNLELIKNYAKLIEDGKLVVNLTDQEV